MVCHSPGLFHVINGGKQYWGFIPCDAGDLVCHADHGDVLDHKTDAADKTS